MRACSDYVKCYEAGWDYYEEVVENAKREEVALKHQWELAKELECLSEAGANVAEAERCMKMDIDTTHLELSFCNESRIQLSCPMPTVYPGSTEFASQLA